METNSSTCKLNPKNATFKTNRDQFSSLLDALHSIPNNFIIREESKHQNTPIKIVPKHKQVSNSEALF